MAYGVQRLAGDAWVHGAIRAAFLGCAAAFCYELLETRIKIFGDAFFEKAFPSVRAPLNRGVDSVKISRGDVPPLNSNSNETSTTFFEKRFNKKFR
jgi:hypothetical protein